MAQLPPARASRNPFREGGAGCAPDLRHAARQARSALGVPDRLGGFGDLAARWRRVCRIQAAQGVARRRTAAGRTAAPIGLSEGVAAFGPELGPRIPAAGA